MTEVTLREVTGCQLDASRIARWRHENAQAFPPQDPWTMEGQQRWYYQVYAKDPSLNLYFVCVDDQPIGTVGMRIENGEGEMMWMILGNKKYARKGYMRQGMRKLMEAYGLTYYWGRVMPDNIAGVKFQLANGFRTVGMIDGMIFIERYFDGIWPVDWTDR